MKRYYKVKATLFLIAGFFAIWHDANAAACMAWAMAGLQPMLAKWSSV